MSPSGDDVRRQLDRLLASAGFANAGRMSRFLRFVVEKSLAGEGERLKEYVIGIEVFDRDASYDPRLDSIVRVEAARLRAKLAEYYTGEGRADAVVLTLPKGGYAPILALNDKTPQLNGAPRTNGSAAHSVAPSEQAAPLPGSAQVASRPRSARWRWTLGALLAAGAATAAVVAWAPGTAPSPALRIAVLPFSSAASGVDGEALAQELTEGVTAELVRAGQFSVVASSAARAEHSPARRPRETAAALDADILISARVRTDGDALRIETYAVSGANEEKLWVDSFAGTAGEAEALERNVAGAIVDAVMARKLAIDR
jgi:adenylate cyclase